MIEPTAIVWPASTVSPTSYIGHFAMVGHPRRIDPRVGADASVHVEHWESSVGAEVMANAVVSAYCHIDDGAVIEPTAWLGSRCRVGHNTRVRRGAQLYYSCQVYDRVDIGQDAVVGGFVCNDARVGARARVFGDLVHRLVDAPATGDEPHPTASEPAPVVTDSAVVGKGAVVVGGVIVGEGAYIAAGAVLTTDADPQTLYVGVPARPQGPAPRPFAHHTG